MIIFDDVQVGDVVKVKTISDEDDIEEDMFARVSDKFSTTMMVKYYNPTSKVYKGACLYELEETEEPVDAESLVEHYIEGSSPFLEKEGMSYLEEEVMSEEDSEIEDMSDDEEEEEDDFVVPDGTEWWTPPGDHQAVDASWAAWVPPTAGGRKFKQMVDNIEMLARLQEDELKNFSP